MQGLENPEYLTAWIVSNLAGILILWAAVQKPSLARGLFVLLFGWASWVNFKTANQTPELYLEYASMAIPWYRDFIQGWFSERITAIVSVIAFGQGLIAVGMALKGVWVKTAAIGSMVFLMGIAPLGVGAGFPFPLTVSAAAWLVFQLEDPDLLWRLKRALPGAGSRSTS